MILTSGLAAALRKFALSILLSALPGSALGCQGTVPTSTEQVSAWYCVDSGDTVVVFIHGLGSSSATAWLGAPSSLDGTRPFWPQFVASDPRLNHSSVYLASYGTRLDSGDYGADDAAEDVFLDLKRSGSNGAAVLDRKNILIVAHSLGGIIARAMLVAHADAFQGKHVGLMLVASPSLGSREANELDTIISLTNNRMAQLLIWQNADLLKLHDRFAGLIRDKETQLPGLVGAELYEQWALTPGAVKWSTFTEALYRRFFVPVVEMESAAVYFAPFQYMVEGSDHLTIATPASPNSRQEGRLVDLYERMINGDAHCTAPTDYKIELKMLTPSPNKVVAPFYLLEQVDERGDVVQSDRATLDAKSGFYSIAMGGRPFSCPGETYLARLVRVPPRGEKSGEADIETPICLQRRTTSADGVKTQFNCEEGRRCAIEPGNDGLANPCKSQVAALMTPPKPAAQIHWITPSLTSIAAMDAEDRPGYTEFHIRSGPLQSVGEANRLSFSVTVNGVPIYMDGLPPHRQHSQFRADGGLDLIFAIENLGFTGGTDGFEKIAVELRFYNADKLLKTVTLERSYISYRNARPRRFDNVDGLGSIEWSGFYRPSKEHESFEVMLTFGSAVSGEKSALENRESTYQGQPIVGVLRPGRVDNGTPGIIFGLRQPTGQVKSLFTREDADGICRWLKAAPGFENVRNSSYLFQFPAEVFNDRADRGQRVGFCWQNPG
jgi:pimeloyl-ACP methyl ester carboxylesterase